MPFISTIINHRYYSDIIEASNGFFFTVADEIDIHKITNLVKCSSNTKFKVCERFGICKYKDTNEIDEYFRSFKKLNQYRVKDEVEWQANNIAGRVLVPSDMLIAETSKKYEEYNYFNSSNKEHILRTIASDLVELFGASKGKVFIRMKQTSFFIDGIDLAPCETPTLFPILVQSESRIDDFLKADLRNTILTIMKNKKLTIIC